MEFCYLFFPKEILNGNFFSGILVQMSIKANEDKKYTTSRQGMCTKLKNFLLIKIKGNKTLHLFSLTCTLSKIYQIAVEIKVKICFNDIFLYYFCKNVLKNYNI